MGDSSEAVRRERVLRYGAGAPATREDRVVIEEPMEIRVGAETLAVTMRTPGHDFELAAGWLVAEGIVHRPEEIVRMEHCREVRSPEEEGNVVIVRATVAAGTLLDRARRLIVTTSSCGLCGKGSIEAVHGHFPQVVSDVRVSANVLRSLPAALREAQAAFEATGGLHAAGVFTLSGQLVASREDIGRHNAVDKVVGFLFQERRLPLSESILLVSGRASFEIVQKAVAAGIPVVAAVSAPSSLAIDLARDSGVSLIGFLREGGFNVYSREDRLIDSGSAR
jgi:FdhD protein